MNPAPATNRRTFLKTTTTATVALAGGLLPNHQPSGAPLGGAPLRVGALIDVNVTLARWPFRRLPLEDTPALLRKLHALGVSQAWAGTFDGLFHKDLAEANERLSEDCRRHGRGVLVPFGSINPKLAGWEDDLERCAEHHKMPGIRLHPGYHGYTLDDPAFTRLLALAAERRLIVQIVSAIEDERTVHSRAAIPALDCRPLLPLRKAPPAGRIMLLNWARSTKTTLAQQLAASGVSLDIATMEGVGGVATLLSQMPSERIFFGSHAPFFYPEAALFKLKESALSAADLTAIGSANARRLLADRWT